MLDKLSNRWPVIEVAVLIGAAYVLRKLLEPNQLADIPFLGSGQKDFMNGGGWGVYAEGYKKVMQAYNGALGNS
jgi:hypothetical protein